MLLNQLSQFLPFNSFWENKLPIKRSSCFCIDWAKTWPNVCFMQMLNYSCASMQGSRKTEWEMNLSGDSLHVFTAKGSKVNCRPQKGQFISSVPVDHAEGARARLRICIEGRRRNWHSYLTTWASICPFRYCEMPAVGFFSLALRAAHTVRAVKYLKT